MAKVSVCLLNWNEFNVSRDSVRRLMKEPDVTQIVLVDNGSTDESKEYFRSLVQHGFTLVDLPENMGPSVARNKGIEQCDEDYIFLLDGDILYVPGTIAEYQKILDNYQDAFCVGQNSFELLSRLGHNGTLNAVEADLRMPTDYTISDWFPMAWTQYGLFRGDLLREFKFIEDGPFGEAGWGYEDDDYYHEMKRLGYTALSVDKPLYYHEAHTGIKELIRSESREYFDIKMKARKKIFDKKWGRGSSWGDSLAKNNPEKTTRPTP